MKKILYLALCALLMAGLIMCFAACGGDEESTGSSGTPDASSNVGDLGAGSSSAGTDVSTDSSSSSTDSTNSSTDSSVPSTDSSRPTTDSSRPTTDSSVPSTDSSVPSTDSSVKDPNEDNEHTHSYSSNYSYDANNHYYQATCDHKDEVTGVEPHAFDEKGDCKCGYHKHVYSNELSFDADNHFNKAICIHTEEIANVEAHSYNEENVCKCGKVKDVIQDVINAIIANKGLITSGNSVQTTYNHILGSVSANEVTYIFYDNYVYVKQEEDYVNEYYYSYDDGKLIAIFVQNGGNVNVDTEASEENLGGARYLLGCVDDYETFACGAESLLEYFYKTGIEKASDVFVATKNGNEYTLDYGFCIVDDWVNYYYKVSATFTVDEATNTLVTAYIGVDRYASENYTVVDGVYVLNEDAEPNHQTTFEITQTCEAHDDVENPYDSAKILLDSIAVKDREGNDIEEIIIKQRADEVIKLFLADITPSTALLSLCDIELIVKNEADGSVVTVNYFYNDYDKSYSFFIDIPGVYEISVRVDDVTFTTTAEISAKVPVGISAQVYDASSDLFNKTKKAEVYAGAPLYFMSYVESGYDDAYVATLVGENAANASVTDGVIGGKAVSVFKSSVLGTYTVEIKSTANNSVSCVLTVTVVEAPSIESLLVGEYYFNDNRGNRIVTAVFDSENSVVDVIYADTFGEETTQLSYTVENGIISYEVVDGDEFVDEFYVNELYQLVMVIYDETYVLDQVTVERTLTASGTISIEDIANEGAYSYTYAFELYSTGEFVFYKDYSKTRDVALTKKNGAYMFKLAGSEAQALVKTSGEAGALAGEYTISGVVNAVITVDSVATQVREPQYGTLEVVDHASSTAESNKSFVYGYEIIDGEFVFYRYGELTTDISLIETNGEYSFKYENIINYMVLEKSEGADDILGGTYVIERYMPSLVRIAEVIIAPGAIAPDKPVNSEKPYGSFMLEDKVDESMSGTYNYEIVNGEFVVYKDGVLTTDVSITTDGNDTYYIQCGTLTAPTALIRVEGDYYALAGYYEVQTETDCLYAVTFVPGILDDEETTGTLVIEDNYNGTVGGTYTYEIVNGGFEIYKDGVLTNEVLIMQNIDGTYSFQCVGIVPQLLNKVEGISVVLEGTYVVNGEDGPVFTLTFTPGAVEDIPVYVEEGTIEITDLNGGASNGTYTYKLTDKGEIYIFKDGVLTNDIIVSITGEDTYSFQCPALRLPQTLVMVKGEDGMLSGKYQVVDGENVLYQVLILKNGYSLPIVYVEDGTVEIVDNNGNAIGGSYEYKITDEGNIVIFKDGEIVTGFAITVGENGEYIFNCAALENAQALVMVKGEDGMLSGKYQVVDGENVLYQVLILKNGYSLPIIYVENGTIEIIDNNDATISGSYEYKLTDEGVYHIFKDGEIIDYITLTAGENDTYYFSCTALGEAVVLVKVRGEYGVLSGGYRIKDGDVVKYDILILKEGYELPANEKHQLAIGENTIVVNDAVNGTEAIYTNNFNGEFTISMANGESNALVYIVINGKEVLLTLPNAISVSAGQTLKFIVRTADGTLDEITLNIKFENKMGEFEDEEA